MHWSEMGKKKVRNVRVGSETKRVKMGGSEMNEGSQYGSILFSKYK